MKIQEKVANSFVYFFKEPWTFILAGLVAGLLTVVTIGILGPVMLLGLTEMFYKMRDGVKPTLDDLFIHMDKTLMLAIQGLVMGIAIGLGIVLLIIPGLILAALWMYAPYYMGFKGMGLTESLKASIHTVNKNGLMNHIFIMLVMALVMGIGAQIVIGTLFTFPLTAAFLGFLFEEVKE